MVRGHGLDRIQVYARIVHLLTLERTEPIGAKNSNERVAALNGRSLNVRQLPILSELKPAIYCGASSVMHTHGAFEPTNICAAYPRNPGSSSRRPAGMK